MKNQLFKNDRYITCGINIKIATELMMLLWELIDRLDSDKRDYLQVFSLELFREKNGDVIQKITHTQEVPSYNKEYYLKAKIAINEKIFIIDDGEQSVMMLAEEY